MSARKDIAVVLISVNTPKRQEYLKQTMKNLERSGLRTSSRVSSFDMVVHEPGKRTAHLNAAEGLRVGSAEASKRDAKWVLFLEDDIDVVDQFFDGVGAWLDRNASEKGHLYSFSVPHPAHSVARGEIWNYPVKYFCCTQAFAVRREDAESLWRYLVDNPTVTGSDGGVSTGAYDLAMRYWAKATWPELTSFYASVPSFVQHVGIESAITPERELIRMPSWPGREWSYTPAAPRKRRLLFVGDAACQTGFARCTHEVLAVLHESWDVTVLGLNYRGDPHEYPYPIFPCLPGGDPIGVGRIEKMIDLVQPDMIIIQNDPWNFPHYFAKTIPERIPLVGVVAVDGKNCRGDFLNRLDLGIFWTQFGLDEARAGGFKKRGAVVPLGVDSEFWMPGDKQAARRFLYKNDYEELKSAFILLNVNRNQPRKRMDLTLRYFAEWLKAEKIDDAYLHLHVAPTGDLQGYDCDHLAKYYGVNDRVIMADMGAWNGVSDKTMRSIFQAADLGVSTTQGEGWGLPAMEGMACGLPQLLPNWSAYGEWAKRAAMLVECTSTSATWKSSVIGGVPDEAEFIARINALYFDRSELETMAREGLALVARPEYRWRAIGEKFRDELNALVAPPSEVPQEAVTV